MIDRIILLNKKPKIEGFNKLKNAGIRTCIHIIIIASSLILLISSYNMKTYSIKKTLGYISCEEECHINLSLPYKDLNIVNDNTIIEVDHKRYKPTEILYKDISIENNIPYQNIQINTEIKDEKIVEVKLLNNKQRIIKKVFDIIREG